MLNVLGGLNLDKEIERKFLFSKIPKEAPIKSVKYIKQTYPIITLDREFRIRSVKESGKKRFYATTKIGRGMSRQEQETQISRGMYLGYLYNLPKKTLRKKRLLIEDDGYVYEADFYKHPFLLRGLRVVEVEFSSEEDAMSFRPPPWFGEEVTHKVKFKNRSIWRLLNAKRKIVFSKLIKGAVLALCVTLFGYLLYKT